MKGYKRSKRQRLVCHEPFHDTGMVMKFQNPLYDTLHVLGSRTIGGFKFPAVVHGRPDMIRKLRGFVLGRAGRAFAPLQTDVYRVLCQLVKRLAQRENLDQHASSSLFKIKDIYEH